VVLELVLTFLMEAKTAVFVLFKDFFILHSSTMEHKKDKKEDKKTFCSQLKKVKMSSHTKLQ